MKVGNNSRSVYLSATWGKPSGLAFANNFGELPMHYFTVPRDLPSRQIQCNSDAAGEEQRDTPFQYQHAPNYLGSGMGRPPGLGGQGLTLRTFYVGYVEYLAEHVCYLDFFSGNNHRAPSFNYYTQNLYKWIMEEAGQFAQLLSPWKCSRFSNF
jgi:hypothetical protein